MPQAISGQTPSEPNDEQLPANRKGQETIPPQAADRGRRESDGKNTPIPCPDPAIIAARQDRGYLVFGTGVGIPIWRSDDLLQWRRGGRVFAGGLPDWAKAAVPGARGLWAPDISFWRDQYWLYYSVSTFGSQRSAIGLAINKTLDPADKEYRWEDAGMVLESAPGKTDFNAIDPALALDRDGQPYLFWGSYWTGIKAAKIDPETGKPLGAKMDVVPIAARAKGVDPPAIEAPFVIHRDGFYYLFVSWDFCCAGVNSTYKIVVGRSEAILGPYLDRAGRAMLEGGGTLLVASTPRWRGPGHNGVLQTKSGDWLALAANDVRNPNLARVLQIRPLYWQGGWPLAGRPATKAVDAAGKSGEKEKLDMTGRWSHYIDFAPPLSLEFRANGTFRGEKLQGRWQLTGAELRLDWPDDRAASGYRPQYLIMEPDGEGYVGRNERGQAILGSRTEL